MFIPHPYEQQLEALAHHMVYSHNLPVEVWQVRIITLKFPKWRQTNAHYVYLIGQIRFQLPCDDRDSANSLRKKKQFPHLPAFLISPPQS